MSEDDSPADDENNPKENSIKFNENFIIKLTNEIKISDKNAKQNCKILQILSELDIDQKLSIISTLKPSEYPNLFIFIIEHQNKNFLNENHGNKARQLDEYLIKFGDSRPLIIQQKFEAENKINCYYKYENSSQIVNIDQHYAESYELYERMLNILNELDGRELEQFEDEMLKKLSFIKDSSIILRFSRTLSLPELVFKILVRFVADSGSKADLFAILDASFDDNGRMLNYQMQNYIRKVIEDEESQSESDEEESTSKKTSDDDQQDDSIDGTPSQSKKDNSSRSVLLTAVQNSNQEIIDYLITYCTPLIQELPVEHQIRISTTACDTNQLDVLCDLLEFSDFPFPEEFDVTNDQINHERLQKIITGRIKFHEGIQQENDKEIKNFIDNNLSLKFVYGPQNITAMKKAVDSQNYKTYFYLKSFGLFASEFDSLEEVLDEKELQKANDQSNIQKTESISDALRHASKSVLILCTRALIHNRKVKKEDETKYRKCIKKWIEEINNISGIMLDVAASCENLVIIFDFESRYVDRTAFRDNVLGLSYTTVSSRIFIGAKLGDSKREQEIKGVLAHELCHYVMCLVYDNKFLPYYKYALDILDSFDGIVKSIDKWSTNDQDQPDDECAGIISSVFTSYPVNCFHFELIVRPVQILVLFDDDPTKSQHLQEKYQELFDFWFTQIVPELQKYLQKNKVVIRINTTVELLSSLSKSKIEFKASKDMEQLTKNRITIVITNVPELLLINIHKHLQEKCGSLLDSQNIFIEPEKIKNAQVWKDLMHLYAKDVKLNIFVNCTKEKVNNLNSILNIKDFNFILVALNEEQATKLKDICIKKVIKPNGVDINYNWSELTEKSQVKLLQTEVTFQNNPKISLIELLSKNINPDENEIKEIIEDFSNTINDHVFNLLIDRQEISINSNVVDSIKNNFENLFRKRNFLKKGVNFKNEISQQKLISITERNKYVLISDIAGSGKSWVVKNISKIIAKQNLTRWVTYVDLKQFIEEFRKRQSENCEFANYFVENILKPKTKFEAEIFKKLYKNGKVSIIFDGFDEIAPDCAEFVASLANLFEFNDGNQLWIVSRDYFEFNLQQKLQIDNVYKLNEFSEEDGINFIVARWILMDLKDQTINNFETHLKNSPNLTKYQEKAQNIVHKVAMSKNQSIGLPQLFSMIADGFKDKMDTMDDLKGAKIFTQFVNTMYTRWADFKGILRKEASVKSQDYELNFKELHQFFAILNLFPELIDKFFPDYDISEWPEVEIIAGGLMNKIGSSYSFNHETFREYFVAGFIFKAIKKPKIKNEIIELLVKVLTIHKYEIIRMFLNDFIDNSSIMEKVQLKFEKSIEEFNKMENLSDYFTENLEHLAKCVVEILKNGNYENVKKILNDNIEAVATKTKDLKMFSMFTEFLFSYLKVEDLKDMISHQIILHKIIGSELDAEIFEYFVLKLEEKAGQELIQQQLKLMPLNCDGNIFHHLGSSQNLSESKVQKCFEIFQKYLVESEIVELMDKCNPDGQTIIHILFVNTMNFKPFLDGANCLFTNQNLFQKFKNTICEADWYEQNILHWSADKEDIDFHTSLWKLIQKIFEKKQELRSFVLQKNKSQNNFLHLLIVNNNAVVIGFTFLKLKEILNESDYQEILKSKGQYGRNLLQYAAARSKEAKNHQILWKAVRDACEFLKILGECDNYGDNVLNIAAAFTTAEIFEFMEKELEKIASRDKIRKLLIKLGFVKKNLLQSAAVQNKSLEFHKTIWKIIKKYFNSSEILEFIKHRDINGRNLLVNVTENNTGEVIELTWMKVKELLNINELITEDHKENIEKCEKILKNISEQNQLKNSEREILKLKWIKKENSEASKLFDEAIHGLMEQNLNEIKFVNLKFFIADENVKNHEKLWENLVKIYTNYADLKKLLSEKNENGNNFIHLLIVNNTTDVIEFTINKFRENLNESDCQEILRTNVQFRRNLLQVAAVNSKEVKTHHILWKAVQDSCKSDEEFLDILREVDEQGNDLFNISASFTTADVFKFMEGKLSKIASRDEIRKLFIMLGQGNRNLLQTATGGNKSFEFHKTLWKILQKYFNSSEILEFAKHLDINGDNLLIIAKEWNTKDIFVLTWMEVEKVLKDLYTDTETVQKIEECEKIVQKITATKNKVNENEKLLKLDWIKNPNSGSSNLFDTFIQNILRNDLTIHTLDDLVSIVTNKNVLNHEIFWDHLLKTFENRQDLTKLLLEKNQNDDNFIHLLVILNQSNVIEFTLNKLKENLSESDFYKILRSKGQLGRSLLENTARASKEVKTYQVLWKELRDSCKSDDEFLKMLEEASNNVLSLAATFTTGEIFKFMQNELEKIASREEIKKLLISLEFARQNLLQEAAQQNESLDLHEALWEIIEKYFNLSEILNFIKHCDVYGKNVLLNAIIGNTKDVKELTWNKVRKALITIGYEDSDNLKKCDEIMKKDEDFLDLTKEEKEILKFDWIDNKNSVQLFKDNIQMFMEKDISDISLNDLMLFMADENVENHVCLWKCLEENFKSYKDLKKLLFEKDKNDNNFIHLLVILNTTDVIEFTIKKLKENLNESNYQEILRSKGQFGRNIIQYAAIASKEVKTHKILWKELQDSNKSDDEFVKILTEVNKQGSNVFHIAAALTTSEVFEFLISELEKLTNDKELIRKLLSSFGQENTILLQFIAVNNKSLETNKTVWKIICKYFEINEIMRFIEHCTVFGDNLLCCAVLWNTTEIVEFTWNQIKLFINTKDAQIEYLNSKGRNGKSLHQLSSENPRNASQVADWVQNVMQEYGILFPK